MNFFSSKLHIGIADPLSWYSGLAQLPLLCDPD